MLQQKPILLSNESLLNTFPYLDSNLVLLRQ